MANHDSTILGISYSHGDSSACVVRGGMLVAAAEEERFNRIKHYGLFPRQAIAYCLQQAGVVPCDVRVVAIARSRLSHWWRKAWTVARHPAMAGHRKPGQGRGGLHELRALGLSRAKIRFFEHHPSHLASARWLCPDESLALFSFDGLGDFVSASYGVADGAKVRIRERIFYPHSLGLFYTAMTQYLGFPHFGDEFKVMGLSSYGQPLYLNAVRELIRTRPGFRFELNLEALPLLKRPMEFGLVKGQPVVTPFYNSQFLTQLIGLPPRKPSEPLQRCHWDLAKSVQVRFEEVANHLLNEIHRATGLSTLALAGGCAHNSVWVGSIASRTAFKHVFVAPASGDAGIAVGAAVLAAQRPITVDGGHWALVGPDESWGRAISDPLNLEAHEFDGDAQLTRWLAKELAEQKIVGLFRGRMEFGPRALGSRSILCDPRSPAMRDRLNARVKHREMFRPFAASVLEEHRDDWFENSFFAPTMEAVFAVKESKRGKIPSVVHVDHSCRIQSVTRQTQPFYWDLIEEFRKLTTVPMLINTSFNDCEPIVCTQEDALACFEHCEMDYLVIGRRVYSRCADGYRRGGYFVE